MTRTIKSLRPLFLSLLLTLGLIGQAVATPISVDDLYTYEEFSNFSMSPDGKYLVFGDNRSDDKRIVVIDLDTMKPVATTDSGGAEINWVRWASDERLLVSLLLSEDIYLPPNTYMIDDDGNQSRRANAFKYTRMIAMDWDGSNAAPMMRGASKQLQSNYDLDGIISMLPDDPQHFLMPGRERGTNLYKVNLYTGTYEKVTDGKMRTFSYRVTRAGEPVIRYDWTRFYKYIRVFSRSPDGGDWKKVATLRTEDRSDFSVLASTENPKELYVSARPGNADKVGAYRFNVATREYGEKIAEHPKYDLSAALTNGDGEYVGSKFYGDRAFYDFADAALNRHVKAIDGYFAKEMNIHLLAITKSGKRWLFRVEGPTEPGSVYVYDATRQKIDPVLPLQTKIKPAQLSKMDVIKYTTRDGLELSGYFTKGQGAGVRPLIMMPHGGPEARDYYLYNPWVQYMASRGYSVFQPNFRGSKGFGKKFAELGYGQWGKSMQDDVTDAAQHLIETGQAKSGNMCIIGASYGGYVALAAAVQTPDLFECAASINGVTEVRKQLKRDRDYYGRDSESFEYWEKSIGNLRKDKDSIDAISPALQADKINIPILLVHGTADTNVPIEQSDMMEEALKQAGKSVEFIRLQGIGHNLEGTDEDDFYGDRKTLEALEAFLGKHLPSNK